MASERLCNTYIIIVQVLISIYGNTWCQLPPVQSTWLVRSHAETLSLNKSLTFGLFFVYFPYLTVCCSKFILIKYLQGADVMYRMPFCQLPILLDICLVLATTNQSHENYHCSPNFIHPNFILPAIIMHRATTLIVLCGLLAASVASAAGTPVSLDWKTGMPYSPVTLSSDQTLTLTWNVGPHTVYEVSPFPYCPSHYWT